MRVTSAENHQLSLLSDDMLRIAQQCLASGRRGPRRSGTVAGSSHAQRRRPVLIRCPHGHHVFTTAPEVTPAIRHADGHRSAGQGRTAGPAHFLVILEPTHEPGPLPWRKTELRARRVFAIPYSDESPEGSGDFYACSAAAAIAAFAPYFAGFSVLVHCLRLPFTLMQLIRYLIDQCY